MIDNRLHPRLDFGTNVRQGIRPCERPQAILTLGSKPSTLSRFGYGRLLALTDYHDKGLSANEQRAIGGRRLIDRAR